MKINLILLLFILLLIIFSLFRSLSGEDIINDSRAEILKINGKMNSSIKGDLISLLQSRMDKCTTEQFWAVGVITGLTALLISEHEKIKDFKKCAEVALIFLSVCGMGFVAHRHFCWFRYELALRFLLENEAIAPKMFKEQLKWYSSPLGVGFYTIWILLTCLAGVISCKRQSSSD